MADPGTPEGKKWMQDRSPLNSASKIKTPLLVVQGANDPRVNRGEAEQIVIALRDRGFPVEYMLAPDEGHGFARPVNNMAMFMAAEKFLAKELDGRYQQSATPEVTKRLAEIMVDPKSVVLTKKADAGAVGAPKPSTDLKPGTWRYDAKVALGPQQIAVKTSTEIKEENGAWVATETMETPMGVAKDVTTMEKGTLLVRKRSISQGPMSVELDYAGDKANGKMNVGGQEKPVAADLGGPLFADGAGELRAIGCLPLADGYTTTYRNFDLQKSKPKLMQLKVAGSESVTTAAGTFETFKVEITSADGGNDKMTLWVAKDSRVPVKIQAVLAALGGGTLTSELVK